MSTDDRSDVPVPSVRTALATAAYANAVLTKAGDYVCGESRETEDDPEGIIEPVEIPDAKTLGTLALTGIYMVDSVAGYITGLKNQAPDALNDNAHAARQCTIVYEGLKDAASTVTSAGEPLRAAYNALREIDPDTPLKLPVPSVFGSVSDLPEPLHATPEAVRWASLQAFALVKWLSQATTPYPHAGNVARILPGPEDVQRLVAHMTDLQAQVPGLINNTDRRAGELDNDADVQP